MYVVVFFSNYAVLDFTAVSVKPTFCYIFLFFYLEHKVITKGLLSCGRGYTCALVDPTN